MFVDVVSWTWALLGSQTPLLAELLRILLTLLVEHALVPRLDRDHVEDLLFVALVHFREVALRTVSRRSHKKRAVADTGRDHAVSQIPRLSTEVILLVAMRVVDGNVAIVERRILSVTVVAGAWCLPCQLNLQTSKTSLVVHVHQGLQVAI